MKTRLLARRTSRFAIYIFIACLAVGCGARNKNVVGLPTGVTQAQVNNWDSAIANLHKISATTSTLRQAVIRLNQTTYTNNAGQQEKVLPDGTAYVALLEGIGHVDQIELEAAAYLKTVPNNWGQSTQVTIQGYMNSIQVVLQNMVAQGVIGIKNPASQQLVSNFIADIAGAANLILSLTQS